MNALPEEAQPADSPEYLRVRTLLGQVRTYLPPWLCGNFVEAMLDLQNLNLATQKRELLEQAYGGRGPEPNTDIEDEVSA